MTVMTMSVKSSAPFAAAFLADIRRAVGARLALVSLPEIGVFVWLLLLVAAPVLIFSRAPLTFQQHVFVEPQSHLLIEAFCGLTALTIAGMILSTCLKRDDPSMILFDLGFLVMGVFDRLHA